jgi:hypothetical protein
MGGGGEMQLNGTYQLLVYIDNLYSFYTCCVAIQVYIYQVPSISMCWNLLR